MSKKSKKYKDAPRFKAIYGYEKSFKQAFAQTLDIAVKDIKKQINK